MNILQIRRQCTYIDELNANVHAGGFELNDTSMLQIRRCTYIDELNAKVHAGGAELGKRRVRWPFVSISRWNERRDAGRVAQVVPLVRWVCAVRVPRCHVLWRERFKMVAHAAVPVDDVFPRGMEKSA